MKSLILSLSFLIMTSLAVMAQDSTATQQPETFEMEWAGEKITMQKYFIVFLKSGPNRNQSEDEAAKLQEQHLAYLGGLYEQGIINLNGPTGGEGDIRGFSVYNVATMEQALEYANADPMVKAGRLVIEAHPWWLAKGSGVK
ncbi:MAG: YciI family protein [Balneola sp.]